MDRNKRLKLVIDKGRYLCKVIKNYIFCREEKTCPFCNSVEISELMDKFFFIKLFRCNNCSLMFRYPKDGVYNQYYRDSCYYDEPKIPPTLPTALELTQLKSQNFKDSIYDISDKITLIKKYVKEGNVLSYGTSWGYELWQFINEGFLGLGYEVDIKRAKFGEENLGLKIIHAPQELDCFQSSFNIVFANHVLEHIGDIRGVFNRIYKLLKDAGYLFIFVPNCSDIDKEPWRKIYAFGQRHCIAFDKHFFYKNLSSLGFSIVEVKECMRDKYELMVIAKKDKTTGILI